MRTARNPKIMNRSQSCRGESVAAKELSAHAATTVVDTPSWTTRAKPKGISRVPTHAVRPVEERRAHTRAKLSLPLRLKRVAGQREHKPPIEIEVCLVDRPTGRGTVRMLTEAHIVRAEAASMPGWHALAATFDDITFQRDEPLPSRFERP